MYADPDRCTGRTHKMLLRVLARCGDPNVKNQMVVVHTHPYAHNLFVAFCQIAEADQFCIVVDLDRHSNKLTVNGTTVRFFSICDRLQGLPMKTVWEEDHHLENVTMSLKAFRHYEVCRLTASHGSQS